MRPSMNIHSLLGRIRGLFFARQLQLTLGGALPHRIASKGKAIRLANPTAILLIRQQCNHFQLNDDDEYVLQLMFVYRAVRHSKSYYSVSKSIKGVGEWELTSQLANCNQSPRWSPFDDVNINRGPGTHESNLEGVLHERTPHYRASL